MFDSELWKDLVAQRCRANSNGGFEGCKNYRLSKGCNYTGHLGATYSTEGLCSACELKEFPDRFTSCIFCNVSMFNFGFYQCSDCRYGIEVWLFDLFYNKNENSKSNPGIFMDGSDETNDWSLYCQVRSAIYDIKWDPKKYLPPKLLTLKEWKEHKPTYMTQDGVKHLLDPFECKKYISIDNLSKNILEVIQQELEKIANSF